MSASLDMSLDDLIKTNKTSGRGGGRGGRSGVGRGGYGGRYGAVRRGFNRQTYRVSPYVKAVPAPAFQQQQILDYEAAASAAATATAGTSSVELQTGIRLYISNLDVNVTTEDLKELFGEVGDLKKCAVHFDSRGRSEGTAEVVFKRKGDGLAAVKRYNSVLLDGKPMKVEVIGGPAAPAPLPPPPAPVRVAPIINPKLLMAPMLRQPQFMGRGGYRGRGGPGAAFRGRGGMRGRGRGRGRGGRSSGPQKTAEELDAEMDAYHAAAAMET